MRMFPRASDAALLASASTCTARAQAHSDGTRLPSGRGHRRIKSAQSKAVWNPHCGYSPWPKTPQCWSQPGPGQGEHGHTTYGVVLPATGKPSTRVDPQQTILSLLLIGLINCEQERASLLSRVPAKDRQLERHGPHDVGYIGCTGGSTGQAPGRPLLHLP